MRCDSPIPVAQRGREVYLYQERFRLVVTINGDAEARLHSSFRDGDFNRLWRHDLNTDY
jgi:hypothetical protein